ncbi:MAG: S-layer homology domain-containing protein [Oscillospiraceae bacterium]|nr:S-layer homology domain-containing protein [Oscillospiraceae bacterium]
MKLKRTLSLMLALVMLVSLMPAGTVFASDGVRDGTISYDFTSESRNQEARAYLERNLLATPANFTTYPKDQTIPDTDAKDQWIYLGTNMNYSGSTSSAPWVRIDSPGYLITHMGKNIWPTSTVGSDTVGEGWLALQIYVPTVGTYDLSMDVETQTTASTNVDIYLGKATDTLNKEYFTSEAVVGTKKALTAGTDENPYTKALATTNNNRIREGAKPFSELGIPSGYLKASGISLKQAQATTIPLTGKLTVNEPGDYLLVIHNKDLSAGETGRLLLSGLTLTPVVAVGADKEKVNVGETVTLSAEVYKADGTVDTSAVIEYTSNDTSKFIIDGNTATAVGAGSAMITASVKGKPDVFGAIVITAKDVPRDTSQDMTYTFSIASHEGDSNKLETRAGVPDASCAKYPENPADPGFMWAYLGTNIPSTGTKSSAYFALMDNNDDMSYILTALLPYDGWIAFKAYVPVSRTYDVSGTAWGRVDTSEKQELYMIPADSVLSGGKTAEETFERTRDGGIYGTVALNQDSTRYVRTGAKAFSDLGIDDSYLISTSNIRASNAKADLKSASGVYLKKGEYIILLREADSSVTTESNRLSISSLTLSPMVVVSADKAAVVDESEPKLSSKVYGLDGKYLPSASVEYTTADTGIIEIDGNKVTPLSRGEATITAKTTVGGRELFGEYKMTVTSPKSDKLSSVSVSLDGEYSAPAYATKRVKVALLDKYGAELELTEEATIVVWYEVGGTKYDGIEENGQWYVTVPAGVDTIELFAEVTYKNDTVKGSSDIEVVNTDNDKHVVIDFMNQPITDVYDATLEEHGWKFVSWNLKTSGSSVGTVALNLAGLKVIPRKIGKGVLEVKIPRSGYYSISVSGNANGIRAAEDVDIYFDGIYAGDYTFYKNGLSSNILPETFRTFYIEAGTHTVTFDCQERKLQVFNPATGELEYVNNTYYGQAYRSLAFFAEESIAAIRELVPAEESYDVNKGESVKIGASLLFENGVIHEIMPSIDGAHQDYSLTCELVDGGEYIDVAEDGTVTAKEVGTAHVRMTASDNTGESLGASWSETVEVVVRDYSKLDGIQITADSFVMRPGEREKITLDKKAVSLGGDDFTGEVSWDSIEWSYDANETNISFTKDAVKGTLTAEIASDAEEGVYTVSVVATLDGVPYEADATVTVTHGKAGRTYYTDERVAIALENIAKYDWAKREKDAAVKAADRYLDLGMEGMWKILMGEGIPRAIRISRRGDKLTSYICRYCGEKVAESGYPWVISPISKPWKVTCPECSRTFPTNDFGKFYELGLGNDGVFDRFLALSRHHNMIYHPAEFAEDRDYVCDCVKPEMMDPIEASALFSEYGTELTNWYKYYGYGQGYLRNDAYSELYTEGGIYNCIDPFRYNADLDENGEPDRVVYNLVGGYDDVKSGMLWCVDDGWGYAPGNAWTVNNTNADKWTFIAHYAHNGFWMAGANIVRDALQSLRLAYVYTGEEKYGRLGAVMIDRMADLYPEYSSTDWVDSTGTKRNWNSLAYAFTDSSFNTGKISNDIWDAGIATELALSYDAFWPMYDDPEVQNFIAEKEAQYPGILVHPVTGEDRLPKNSNKNIRDNIERDLIYEIYNGLLAHDINGNYGSHQKTAAVAAVVYDREPATREIIDWLFAESKVNSSTAGKTFNTGGELLYKIVNDVSRDGQGTESSSSYNYGWIEDTVGVATALGLYSGELTEKENLWRNPKYITMLLCYNDMIDLHRGTQSIGDQGIMGSYRVMPSDTTVIAEAYKQLTVYTAELENALLTVDENDRAELEEKIGGYKKAKTELAQLLYELVVKGKNYALEDLHYDIFTKNPENLYADLKEEIETSGEHDFDRSSMMTGYGFASLRDGTLYNEAVGTGSIKDTTRDFWMYFGGALSHAHRDFLNLGIDAYGISISSDNGYPEQTGSYPSRHQWTNVTLSHNTVVINETSSVKPEDPAKPLHFDDKDTRVKLMDVDGSATYQTADEYRRTVMMIDYDDEISYGVDFFKVLGGEDHIYSFHASSNTVTATTGLDSIAHQTDNGKADGNYVGTYAGADAQFGNDPWTNPTSQYVPLKYPSGYTWLEKIRKDTALEGNFSVDYKISDVQKLSRNNGNLMDIHLKVTTANDWIADEVTLAQSVPSRREGWDKVINRFEYLLVRRKAKADEKLDTLYTTVFEPYNKTPYIKSIDRIEMVPADSSLDLGTDKAAAVRVELVDGRIDYVMYATRNDVLYTVTDNTASTETGGYSFVFKGFAGVWTVKHVDGKLENMYSYLHDGTVIGDDPAEYTNSISGEITWHTEGLSIVNKVKVKFDKPIDAKLLEDLGEEDTSLSGRIFVGETTAPGNAAYIIEDAEISEDGKTATLNFAHVTLVNSYDSYEDDTYNYDVAEGMRFTIPMSYENNNAPEFKEKLEEVTATAGSSVSVQVKAESMRDDGIITYAARTLPRGASLNTDTGVVTWKPNASQIGENLVAVDAIDSLGRVSTQYFVIKVYGSTSGSPSTDNDSEGSTDTPSGGGGGGGGGAAPAPDTDENVKPDDGETTNPDNGEDTTVGEGVPALPSKGFTDLTSHAWAADAINELAKAGIIKGTSETTFSPANNITRADFAILLVRAFGLESDNTENFADVEESDYFASELAIARNTGIVGGIGDNKYAPRNTITRQDMMVIVYRALSSTLVGEGLRALPLTDEVSYPDFDTVADYAQEAVSFLISEGLVNGKNGRIDPSAYTTRAEVAVLLKRILDYIKA